MPQDRAIAFGQLLHKPLAHHHLGTKPRDTHRQPEEGRSHQGKVLFTQRVERRPGQQSICRGTHNSLIFRHLVCPESMPNPVGTGIDADGQKNRDSHEGLEATLNLGLGIGGLIYLVFAIYPLRARHLIARLLLRVARVRTSSRFGESSFENRVVDSM